MLSLPTLAFRSPSPIFISYLGMAYVVGGAVLGQKQPVFKEALACINYISISIFRAPVDWCIRNRLVFG